MDPLEGGAGGRGGGAEGRAKGGTQVLSGMCVVVVVSVCLCVRYDREIERMRQGDRGVSEGASAGASAGGCARGAEGRAKGDTQVLAGACVCGSGGVGGVSVSLTRSH